MILFKKRWPALFLIIFLAVLFSKLIFRGLLPIPSDLLVSWFFPFSSGGFPSYSSWTTHKGLVADDAIRQQYPWKIFAANQWKTGEVPLWNPYAFSGYPQAANLQTGAFYPLNALFLVLDPKIAWTILIIFQPLLSFLFMYLFLRTLKLSKPASVFGSLVFMGMTFELLWLEQMVIGHTTLWLPLVLTAIQKFWEGKDRWWFVGVISLSLSILAGYAQTTLYVFLVSGFFLICKLLSEKEKERRWRRLISCLLMFIFPILISAIQLLPTWEIYQFSAREGITSRELFGKFLATPRHLLTLFSPDFFGNVATENSWGDQYADFNLFFGSVALIIIVVGLYLAFKKKLALKGGRWFLILGILGLLFAFPPLGFLPEILHIPILSTGVPARFLFIFQFSAAVVSAFALQFLLEKKSVEFSLKPAAMIFLLIVSLTLGFFLMSKNSSGKEAKNYRTTSRNLILATVVIGGGLVGLRFLRQEKTKMLGFVVLLCFASVEYLYLANKYLPFAKKEYLFPDHPLTNFLQEKQGIDRFWGEGTAYMGTNLPTYYGLYYPEGYDSLYNRRYGELVYFAQSGKLPQKIPRSDVNIKQDSIYKEKLLDLLGVKYILDKNDFPKSDFEPEDWKFPPQKYKLIWQQGKFKIYENLKSLPRIYFAEQLIFKNNDKEILEEIYQGQHREKFAILEEPLVDDLAGGKNGEVMIEKYSPNKIILATKNESDGFLVLSDNYFPGWQARIDGREAKIYRTNYTFRGVAVPKGTHKVVFIYKPSSFKIGAIVSLVSLLIVTTFSLSYGKHKVTT